MVLRYKLITPRGRTLSKHRTKRTAVMAEERINKRRLLRSVKGGKRFNRIRVRKIR